MNNIPHQGIIDPDDWGELLSVLLECNHKVKKCFEKFEKTCRGKYRDLQAKGYPEEDIREILFLTDWQYELKNACADATVQLLKENHVEVAMKVRIPEDQTELQKSYLKMLQAKYKTSSGCLRGDFSPPQEQANDKA